MLSFIPFILAMLCIVHRAESQEDGSLWPPWIPLAVRSPYLSTWMNGTNIPLDLSNIPNNARVPTLMPVFFTGNSLSWSGLIRISDEGSMPQSYGWTGGILVPSQSRPILTDMQITPTRTILSMVAGPLNLTITFLSPIEPANPVLQSLPFTYVAVDVASNDNLQHNVQIYMGITGDWLAYDHTQIMTWTLANATSAISSYALQLQTTQQFSEVQEQAEDGIIFWTMPRMPAQTWMVDTEYNCLTEFVNNSALLNQVKVPSPGLISAGTSFAFSVNLGNIDKTESPVIFAIGMARDPSIQYISTDGTSQPRSPYWASDFSGVFNAATFFVADYPNAISRAIALDQKLRTAAMGISAHYADLVSLAARQAMSGMELTLGQSDTDPNQWNTSDVKMFMKNLGTDGRVNPVEGLYQAFPFFLVLNATYCGWLLQPVLEFADSNLWSNPYAPKDIGMSFPNATGNTSPHNQGVEQSGNMLIMALAHARATGDTSLIVRYYGLLKQWADYLGNHSYPLDPAQQSADTATTAKNLTNLAIKGIIGIRAMADISSVMGVDTDTRHYSNVSATFASQWQQEAVSSDGQHILTSFGDPDTSMALTYNLYADVLLETRLISSQLYSSQTKALTSLLATSNDGLPIDSSLPDQSNAVWALFAAAYSNDTSIQQQVIDQIWNKVANNASGAESFMPTYGLNGRTVPAQIASPLVGGVFALLALNVPANPTITDRINSAESSVGNPSPSQANPTQAAASPKAKGNAGEIAGIVFGCLVGIAGLGIAALFLWRKRSSQRRPFKATPLITPSPFLHQSSPNTDIPRNMSEVTHSVFPRTMSRKETEGLFGVRQEFSQASPASSVTSPPADDTAAHQASSVALSDPAGLQSDSVRALRSDLENLRQLVHTIREEGAESPPEYRSELEAV